MSVLYYCPMKHTEGVNVPQQWYYWNYTCNSSGKCSFYRKYPKYQILKNKTKTSPNCAVVLVESHISNIKKRWGIYYFRSQQETSIPRKYPPWVLAGVGETMSWISNALIGPIWTKLHTNMNHATETKMIHMRTHTGEKPYQCTQLLCCPIIRTTTPY